MTYFYANARIFSIFEFIKRRIMNTTKKWLIIVAIIFNFVDVAWEIYSLVNWFKTDPALRSPVFYVVYDFIVIACCIAVAVLLIMAIWGNGKLFRQRYGYYMTALVISIIVNLLSVSSVLLIITMFISDWVWIKPDKEKSVKVGDNVEVINETKAEKITRLKKMRAEGKISEEEYNEELMKLL